MDALRRRQVLWLAGVMVSGYAGSALLLALGFGLRQRWLSGAGVLALAVAMAASGLIRPAALGVELWWTKASTMRRVMNVIALAVRVAGVAIVGLAVLEHGPR